MAVTTTLERLPGAGVTLTADRWTPEDHDGRRFALLLHGGGQTRHSWQRTGARLAEHGWCAFAIDARGHGESDWAADGDYSSDAQARDLASVVSRLPDRPVFIGASMGGIAALTAQARNSMLAKALVLVDITPRSEPEGLHHINRFMERGIIGFDSLDEVLDAVVAYNPQRRRQPRIEGLMKNLREDGGRWYWHWDPRFLEDERNRPEAAWQREEHARECARRIDVPTLLIRGLQSDIVSDEGARELLELIPGARQIDIDGAGHMVAGDDNDVLTAGLIEFLDGLN